MITPVRLEELSAQHVNVHFTGEKCRGGVMHPATVFVTCTERAHGATPVPRGWQLPLAFVTEGNAVPMERTENALYVSSQAIWEHLRSLERVLEAKMRTSVPRHSRGPPRVQATNEQVPEWKMRLLLRLRVGCKQWTALPHSLFERIARSVVCRVVLTVSANTRCNRLLETAGPTMTATTCDLPCSGRCWIVGVVAPMQVSRSDGEALWALRLTAAEVLVC